jgi:hypothetical protein
MDYVTGSGSSSNRAMTWMAVLFPKDALVTGDRVLSGRELAGPEHTANFVSASVPKATVPSIHVLKRR